MTNYYKIQILEVKGSSFILKLKEEISCETDNLKSAIRAFQRTVEIQKTLAQMNNQSVRVWLMEMPEAEDEDELQSWEEDYNDCDNEKFWSIIWAANITAEKTTIARQLPLSTDHIIYPQDLT